MLFIVLVLVVALTHGLSSSSSGEEWQLDLVQILFRNGISAPEVLYPNDPNHPNVWEEGMGQLTLMGQKQLYTLGKVLRKKYSNFLTSNPHELKIRSSYLDKCMSSALCLLASLYEPSQSWEFIPGLKWQPIPVSYEPPHDDKILKSYSNFESMGIKLTPEYETAFDKYKKQLIHWTRNSGLTVNDCFQASALYKILSSELVSNHTVPKWAWTYWDEMKNLSDFSYKVAFKEPLIVRMVGGPLLVQMVKNIVGKRDGKIENMKLFIYSGQSYHLAGFLGALDCFNGKEPPFGATFLMELLKRKSQENITNFDYAVKMSYYNEMDAHLHMNNPKTLVIPGCEEICPLNHLTNFTRQWFKTNRRAVKYDY